MGASIANEDEFARQFREIDLDEDGIVSFDDLERFLRLTTDSEASLSESCFSKFVQQDATANR